MSKPAGIVQKGNEAPSEFYERLCEAYSLYTPIEPEATGSQIVINLAFISQACPYIKRKLQKTEGVLSMPSSQLIETADKVFQNRDVDIFGGHYSIYHRWYPQNFSSVNSFTPL